MTAAMKEETWDTNPDRNCLGQSPDLFFPVEVDPRTGDESEPAYADPHTKNLCSWCPVRVECLEFALLTDQESGIWGGMTTYERSLIKRPKKRKLCASCGSRDIVTEANQDLCLACGLSWDIF
jgi:WhiB family transcriptional regulator, redox-sensing transcriptional regulator